MFIQLEDQSVLRAKFLLSCLRTGEKGRKKKKKKTNLLNRGLEPLLSPSPAYIARIVPVEPHWLVSKLEALIAEYIVPHQVC